MDANYMDVNNSLVTAVHLGNLEKTRKLINFYGLSNLHAWSKGYFLLCHAVEKKHTAIAKLLLTSGAKVNSNNTEPINTPLHFACINGDMEIVKMLLDKGANVNVKNLYDRTPLHNAIKNKRTEVTELLLKQKADVNTRDNDGTSPIHDAVEIGCLQIVEHLLNYGAQICVSPDILSIAVMKGSIKIVEALLQHDADINAKDKHGRTALHFTASSDYEDCDVTVKGEIAELLLSKGARVDAQTFKGVTTLFAAIEKGYIKVVEALLKYNANVYSGVKSYTTPLHVSAHRGNEEICTILLNKGANVNAKRKFGTTALHLATQKGHKEVVKVLLERGAKVDSKMNSDFTPLHLAAKKDYHDIVEIILKFGANIDSRDVYGRTPLHCATHEGHKEVVKVLLEHGAQVDSKMKRGLTPLHLGAYKGYLDIVETLLKYGANIYCRDEYGRTALHVASQGGHKDVVDTLLEYGSDINITSRNNYTPLGHAMNERRVYIDIVNYCFPVSDDDDNAYNDDYIDDDNDYYEEYIAYEYYKCCFKPDATVEVLKRQIVKMKTANLYVSEQNLQLMSKSGEIIGFQDECEEEIARMKNEKINNHNISFYDILAKGTSSLAICMRNENVVWALKSGDYKKKFPLYSCMIECHFRKAMERKESLDQGHKNFHFLFNNLSKLPYDCTEQILNYLSNEDLRNLMDACKPLSISTPNTNINDAVITSSYVRIAERAASNIKECFK